MTASRRAAFRTVRLAIGWTLLALFLGMVALWTAYGFDPELSAAAPAPFDAFGRPGEFWPIAAAFVAGFGAALTLAPGLQNRSEGSEGGVGVSPLAAAVLGPSAVLIAFAAYWPCNADESPVWSSLRHALEAFEGYVAEPFGVMEGCPAEFPQGLMAAVLFAKIALALALGLAIAFVFQRSLQQLRARLSRQVVVFAGLDDDTVEAARALRKNLTRRQKLVIFDEGKEGGRARSLAREIGAIVLSADVTDSNSVESFMRGRGKRGIQGLYLLSPDSAANIRAMESFLDWNSRLGKTAPARDVEQHEMQDALELARRDGYGDAQLATETPGSQTGAAASRRERPIVIAGLGRLLSRIARAVVPGRSEIPPRVVIRIDNPWHAEDWRRREMIGRPGWLFDSVSVFEIAARHVVERAKRENIDQFVITGASLFELAMLSELSFGHRVDAALQQVSSDSEPGWRGAEKFAPYKPATPAAILVGADAKETASHFEQQLRRYGVQQVERLVRVETGTAAQVMEGLANPHAALILSDTSDYDPTFLAARHPRWRIFDWSTSVHGLTKTNLMGGLSMVGPTLEPVPGLGLDIWERLGRVQHLSYLLHWRGGRPDQGDRKRGDWDTDLDAFTKESNIRAFATICRSIGGLPTRRSWATDLGPDGSQQELPLTPVERAAAAIREHESWMRHHLEYGWSLGAPSPVKAGRRRNRLHPDLVPWEQLTRDEESKDFDSVDSALGLLKALGFTMTGAAVYYRTPNRVTAEILSEPWVWTTGNGDRLTARPGDLRLTDPTTNEQWSITATALELSYTSIGGNSYEARGQVTARQIEIGGPEEVIVSLEGHESATEGDWVVTDDRGSEWVVARAEFERRYSDRREPQPGQLSKGRR